MRFNSIGALLSLAALGGVSLAALPACADEMSRTVEVPICGAHGFVRISLDGSKPAPARRDCVSGCHALCGRKKCHVERSK